MQHAQCKMKTALFAALALFAAEIFAQATETGGAAGFAGAGLPRLDAAWASNNHVKASAYYEDYDNDCLENWAEVALDTSPWTNDIAGVSVAAAKAIGACDLVPGAWKAAHGLSSPLSWSEDPDGDGWDNWSEWMSGTDPIVATNLPNPRLRLTVDYGGALSGKLIVWCHSSMAMNGWPDAVYARDVAPATLPATVELTDADLIHGHLKQGANWFFAWMDGGAAVAGLPAWTAGCPAAISANFLDGVDIGFGCNDLSFVLTDNPASSVRVSWRDFTGNGYNAAQGQGMYVTITFGGDFVFKKLFSWPRTWLHEGDVIAYHAAQGHTRHCIAWQAAVGSDEVARRAMINLRPERNYISNGSGTDSAYTVDIWMHDTLPPPVAYWPLNGDTTTTARPVLRFALDPEFLDVAIEIKKQGSDGWHNPMTVYIATNPVPERAYNPQTGRRDLVLLPLPVCIGDSIGGVTFSAGEKLQWVISGLSSVTVSSPAIGYVDSTGMGNASWRIAFRSIRLAADTSAANTIRVAAWPDPACAGAPAAVLRNNGAEAISARVYGLPGPGPWFVKAWNDAGIGFAGHRNRPVPVYAEPAGAPLSITNRIVIRDCN